MKKVVCVFAGGQQGDVMSAMSMLHYRDELFGTNHKLIWYINPENRDLLAYQENIELRDFPRGYGYPQMVIDENKKLIDEGKKPIWVDFEPLVDWNNRMNMALVYNYPELSEVTEGYFPLTHQVSVQNRHSIEYPNVSKKVFGIPDSYEWHPVLKFSEEEREKVKEFMYEMPHVKTVCIETFAGSGQSKIDGVQISNAMVICRQILGDCNFIFMSHKYLNGNEKFPDGWINGTDIFSASHFTVRQCALVVGMSDLLISVSSGITVAASCWGNTPVPVCQFTGSRICSTYALALGRFELITTDGKHLRDAVIEFNVALYNILNEIK